MTMLVNRALGIWRDPLSRPVRRGKTDRDRANGNAARNAMRKSMRAAWQQDNEVKAASRSGATVKPFPG